MAKLRKLISKHEGYSDKPYTDSVGKLTIGYGRNLEEKGISRREAELMLDEDIRDAELDAAKFDWFADLDEVRQAVIVNMIFNLGLPRFKGFANTIRLIEEGNFQEASEEMLRGSDPDTRSLWYKQVGRRAEELSEMLKTGEWPSDIA